MNETTCSIGLRTHTGTWCINWKSPFGWMGQTNRLINTGKLINKLTRKPQNHFQRNSKYMNRLSHIVLKMICFLVTFEPNADLVSQFMDGLPSQRNAYIRFFTLEQENQLSWKAANCERPKWSTMEEKCSRPLPWPAPMKNAKKEMPKSRFQVCSGSAEINHVLFGESTKW